MKVRIYASFAGVAIMWAACSSCVDSRDSCKKVDIAGYVQDENGTILHAYEVGIKEGLPSYGNEWETAFNDTGSKMIIFPGPPDFVKITGMDGSFKLPVAQRSDSTLFIRKTSGEVYAIKLLSAQISPEKPIHITLAKENRALYSPDNDIAMSVQRKGDEVLCIFSRAFVDSHVNVSLAKDHLNESEVVRNFLAEAKKMNDTTYAINVENLPEGPYTVAALILRNGANPVSPRILIDQIMLEKAKTQ